MLHYEYVHFWIELTLARSLEDGPALIWPNVVRRSQSICCSLEWELIKCCWQQQIHITPQRKRLWATTSPDCRNKTRQARFNHQVRFNCFSRSLIMLVAPVSTCEGFTHSRCCSLQCLCLSASQMCLAAVSPTSFSPTERRTSFDTPDIKILPSAWNTSLVSSHLLILHQSTHTHCLDFT